mmetsp:Transcript_31643/g.87360  ORF Transcript_31643/g.87360 Transcript_31643/m.87360 type:complete len:525 (+) Transcript_31643:168-1742(+)
MPRERVPEPLELRPRLAMTICLVLGTRSGGPNVPTRWRRSGLRKCEHIGGKNFVAAAVASFIFSKDLLEKIACSQGKRIRNLSHLCFCHEVREIDAGQDLPVCSRVLLLQRPLVIVRVWELHEMETPHEVEQKGQDQQGTHCPWIVAARLDRRLCARRGRLASLAGTLHSAGNPRSQRRAGLGFPLGLPFDPFRRFRHLRSHNGALESGIEVLFDLVPSWRRGSSSAVFNGGRRGLRPHLSAVGRLLRARCATGLFRTTAALPRPLLSEWLCVSLLAKGRLRWCELSGLGSDDGGRLVRNGGLALLCQRFARRCQALHDVAAGRCERGRRADDRRRRWLLFRRRSQPAPPHGVAQWRRAGLCHALNTSRRHPCGSTTRNVGEGRSGIVVASRLVVVGLAILSLALNMHQIPLAAHGPLLPLLVLPHEVLQRSEHLFRRRGHLLNRGWNAGRNVCFGRYRTTHASSRPASHLGTGNSVGQAADRLLHAQKGSYVRRMDVCDAETHPQYAVLAHLRFEAIRDRPRQ